MESPEDPEEVIMYQPYSSGGQAAGPLRPPAAVRAAVKVMYAGAAISTAPLVIALATPIATSINAYHLRWGSRSLTAAQISQWRPLIITVVVVAGLAVPAVWLWMARANGQGRDWARILSTVLFGLATLHLFGHHGVVPVVVATLTWLAGLAAVWLLWRPASSAFFKGQVTAARAAVP